MDAGSSVYITGFITRKQPGFRPRRPGTAVGTLDITTNLDLNGATITKAPPLVDARSPICDFTTLAQESHSTFRQVPHNFVTTDKKPDQHIRCMDLIHPNLETAGEGIADAQQDVLHVKAQMVLAPQMVPAQQHHIFKLGIADRTDDIQVGLRKHDRVHT
jgi:hypothetical protein